MVLLVYAITLLAAVLISKRAERTVLSTAVLFLVAGFLVGRGVFGPAPQMHGQFVARFAELALFSVLFTDGMRLSIHELARDWLLPARALFRGMPLTIGGIALVGRYVAHLSWPQAFLVGAALSPTDPVFVAAIFRIDEVPERVKHLLNVESGLNDGLALPVVLVLLSIARPHGESWWHIAEEMLLGIVVGVVVPWAAIHLERVEIFGATEQYQALNAFAIGLIILGVCYVTNANLFLAAFSAGMSVATFSPEVRDSFQSFGELVAELLKLAALLLFAMLVAPRFFERISWRDLAFVFAAVFLVRLVVFELSMVKTGLTHRQRLIAGWFGPKGFASVVYGFMIWQASFPGSDHLAHIMAIAIVASIVVYSSTDILVARWLKNHPIREEATTLRPAA
jgi:sodium/hydrogen antiporter